jgi:hypothetical protein
MVPPIDDLGSADLVVAAGQSNFRAEKANSLFIVTGSSLAPSRPSRQLAFRDGLHKFLADFMVAPVLKSLGRPFNILTNQDTNNDQSNQTDDPMWPPMGRWLWAPFRREPRPAMPASRTVINRWICA